MKRGSGLLAEGLVIVVSVLLALSAEAWWAGRQDTARAREHLIALSRDFEQMSIRVDSSLRITEAAVAASSSLLDQLTGDMPALARDSAVPRVVAIFSYEVFSPNTGSYSALVGSGRLGLIQDEVLKREFGDFFGSFDDVRVTEQLLLSSLSTVMESSEFAELVGLHHLAVGNFRATDELMVQWAESDVLLNGIAAISFAHKSVLEDYVFLRESIDRIQALLED